MSRASGVVVPSQDAIPAPHRKQSDKRACENLIIVCCHAIWLGGDTLGAADNEWAMEPFQAGEGPTFAHHIHQGVDALLQDERAMLVFSGAATKKRRTDITEGDSYKALALALRAEDLKDRIVMVEPWATDSFQNLLFSMLAFWRETGHAPASVTVVSHLFKQSRFANLHRVVLNFPSERFHFLGADPPDKGAASQNQIRTGEAIACDEWKRNPFGAWGKLREKRQARGFVVPTHLDRVSQLAMLWEGSHSGKTPFPYGYPWEEGGEKMWAR